MHRHLNLKGELDWNGLSQFQFTKNQQGITSTKQQKPGEFSSPTTLKENFGGLNAMKIF